MTEPETLPDQPQDDATAPEAETGDDVQVAFDVGELPGGARAAIEAVLMVVEEPVSPVMLATALDPPVDQVEGHPEPVRRRRGQHARLGVAAWVDDGAAHLGGAGLG